MKIGCVVLAAGNARRFGSNKLQVQVDGESLIRRALETVPSGLVTVVVSQYPEILSLAGEYGFEAVWNDPTRSGAEPQRPSGSGTTHGLRRGSVPRGRSAVAEAGQRRSAGRALGPAPSEDRCHGPRRCPWQSLPLSRSVLPGAFGPQWGPGRQRRHPSSRRGSPFAGNRCAGTDGH